VLDRSGYAVFKMLSTKTAWSCLSIILTDQTEGRREKGSDGASPAMYFMGLPLNQWGVLSRKGGLEQGSRKLDGTGKTQV
jgi:hypothetical protein